MTFPQSPFPTTWRQGHPSSTAAFLLPLHLRLRGCSATPSSSTPLSARPHRLHHHFCNPSASPSTSDPSHHLSITPVATLTLPTLPPTSDLALTGTILCTVIAWLAIWQTLTTLGKTSTTATRKIFHLTCGPAFILLWPFYTNTPTTPLLASTIPILFSTLLTSSATTPNPDAPRASLGRTVSRGGNPREALQGPLYYTLVLAALTLLLFKTAAAAIAVSQLCVGDAMAEIIGRRWGASSQWVLPWPSQRKSVVGSTAFALSAWVASIGAVEWMHYWLCTPLSLQSDNLVIGLAAISLACAAVELAPRSVAVDDNMTIAITAVTLSVAIFGDGVL